MTDKYGTQNEELFIMLETGMSYWNRLTHNPATPQLYDDDFVLFMF
jgi:hypothetical protein